MENSKPTPFTIIIVNEADEIQRAVLFGGEKRQKIENYGSDKGIKIMSGIPNVSYGEMLAQSIACPFIVDLTKVYSTTQQLALPLTYTYNEKRKDMKIKPPTIVDAKVNEVEDFADDLITIMHPIELENVNGCAEVHQIEKIADETIIDLNVLPKTIIVIKLYPAKKPNIKMSLSGQAVNRV